MTLIEGSMVAAVVCDLVDIRHKTERSFGNDISLTLTRMHSEAQHMCVCLIGDLCVTDSMFALVL